MTQSILHVIDSEHYFEHLMELVKDATADGDDLIYVTTNKPYKNLVEAFKDNSIDPDNIFFIDCISKHVGERFDEEPENCLLLTGPEHLTELSISISEAAKEGGKTLLLDSLSVLLIYNDATTIGKFSNFLINKMRTLDVDTIILALESDVDKDVIQQIQSVVEEVVHN